MAKRVNVVLGAGISGLTAARALLARGQDAVVLEACPSVGGMTRSIRVGEFSFDYTGHLLHLARYGSPAGVPFAGLRDADWQRIERRSVCAVGGRLVAAPLQYHIWQLPPEMRRAAVESYDRRPALPTGQPTFRDYVVSGFGQYLSDVFLIPQNQKTMATSLDRLSISAVKRFFPPPDEARVRAGMADGAASPPEYNSQFWYPKVGGIERLVDGLAHGIQRVELLQEAARIDLAARTLHTRRGTSFSYDRLYSCAPLSDLCRITGDGELRELAAGLTHSATVSFDIGIRGQLSPDLAGVHWVYVPDTNIPFYRVGIYSNITSGLCPPGCASFYVEVGVPGDQIDSIDIAGDLQPRVLRALQQLGWLELPRVICSVSHVMRCAYVHHTPHREAVIQRILARLDAAGIRPIGRYGLWDYTSMEDSIASAIAAVERDD